MDIEKLVEDGARALCGATSGPFELLTPEGRSACRHEARAVLAIALRAAAEEAERINELPRSKALEDFMHTLSDLAAQLGDSDG